MCSKNVSLTIQPFERNRSRRTRFLRLKLTRKYRPFVSTFSRYYFPSTFPFSLPVSAFVQHALVSLFCSRKALSAHREGGKVQPVPSIMIKQVFLFLGHEHPCEYPSVLFLVLVAFPHFAEYIYSITKVCIHRRSRESKKNEEHTEL